MKTLYIEEDLSKILSKHIDGYESKNPKEKLVYNLCESFVDIKKGIVIIKLVIEEEE